MVVALAGIALTIAVANTPQAGGKSDALKTYRPPKRLATSADGPHMVAKAAAPRTPAVYA